jgi:capsular polysaccharide transport system permease protein
VKKRTPWQIQRAVIFALLMRELKTRFGGHWTGVVWLLMGTPLAQVFMLVAINTFLRGRLHAGLYEYAIFLLVALIPFRMSTGLWSQLMHAPKANQGCSTTVRSPRWMLLQPGLCWNWCWSPRPSCW